MFFPDFPFWLVNRIMPPVKSFSYVDGWLVLILPTARIGMEGWRNDELLNQSMYRFNPFKAGFGRFMVLR